MHRRSHSPGRGRNLEAHRSWRQRENNPGSSHVLNELRVQVGEPGELGLVQVHHEQLVGWRQVRLLRRELLVEVVDVLSMFLKQIDEVMGLPCLLREARWNFF